MTVLGMTTSPEVKEFRDQKISDVNAYTRKYNEIKDRWGQRDPVAAKSWGDDWKVFLDRWSRAVTEANALLLAADTQFLVPAEPAMQILLRALQKEEGHFQRGDFPDFIDRWAKAGNDSPDIDTKQPSAVDLDLQVFKASDKAVKKIESTAKDATPWIVAGGIGLLGFLWLTRK